MLKKNVKRFSSASLAIFMSSFLFFKESKAVESGEGDTQGSSHLMLTSAAGLNIVRHLQENSLCELSLQYLFEVRFTADMSFLRSFVIAVAFM